MAKVTRGPAISSQRTRQDPRSEGDQIFLTPEQLDWECKLYPFQKLLVPAQLLPNLCIVPEQLDWEYKLYPFQKLLVPAQLLPNLCIVLEFGQRFLWGGAPRISLIFKDLETQ